MPQRTLFGNTTKEKTKKYVVYKNPQSDYESFIERFCLREKSRLKLSFAKKTVVGQGQIEWKRIKDDPEAIKCFLKLRHGEKPFVIYNEDGYEMKQTVRELPPKTGYFHHSSTPSLVEMPEQIETTGLNMNDSLRNEIPFDDPSIPSTSGSTASRAARGLSNDIPDAHTVMVDKNISVQPYWKETFILFCQKVGCAALASNDVINNKSFMEGIYKPCRTISHFIDKQSEYKSTKKRCAKTALSSSISDMNIELNKLRSVMNEASEITAPDNLGLNSMITAMQMKAGMLQKVLLQCLHLQTQLKETGLIDKIQKRVTQVVGKPKNILKKSITTDLNLSCLNTQLNWTEAYVALENSEDSGIASKEELRANASYIQKEFCVSIKELGISSDVVDLLMMKFPLMKATEGNKEVLIDKCELLIQQDCFLRLLLRQGEVDENSEEESSNKESRADDSEMDTNFPQYGPSRRTGRPPLFEKFPDLIEKATTFIKQHSFAAHARRRVTTATGNGVSLKEICDHLIKNVPGLLEAGGISRDAVHHLTIAPRKNTLNAHRYKGLIDARIPGKRNQYRENNENQHFLFARVSYREELISQFSDESQFYSADDMNKLRMGPATAVSRYHQNSRFFATGNAPNLGDHDFPNPEYLLCPSGYMSLSSKDIEIDEEYIADELNDMTPENADEDAPDVLVLDENSIVNECGMIRDKLGRLHYQKLKAGPAFIKLRACKFDPSSSMRHANDLLPVLTAQVNDGKTCAFIKVDNGGDWNLHTLVNAYYMHRLWKDSGLDILGIVSYAAAWSAYNNIEHLWSPVSKRLCSVILPSILEGDDKAPCKMTKINDDERRQKEATLFDNAMDTVVSNYWNDLTFNGNAVTTSFKNCLDNEEPYNDYKIVHKLLSGGINAVRNKSDLMKELRAMFRHMERKSNELIFRKCVEPRCDFCPSRPVQCTKLWDYLKERDFKWANPLSSMEYPGHYMTFLEMSKVDNESLKVGDDGLPNSLTVGSCPYCPNLLFMSNAERVKHLKIVHHHLKGDGNKVWKAEHRCFYIVKGKRCNLVFDNQTKLKEHRLKEEHTVKRKKEKRAPAKDPKQLRLDSMLSKTTKNIDSESTEAASEDECEVEENPTPQEHDEPMEEDDEPMKENDEPMDDEGNESETDDAEDITVIVDEYVVAVYVDDHKAYVGKIIEKDGKEVHITFMEPSLKDSVHYLRWPKSDDEVWVDVKEILCVVPEPSAEKRGYVIEDEAKKSALDLHAAWINKNAEI